MEGDEEESSVLGGGGFGSKKGRWSNGKSVRRKRGWRERWNSKLGRRGMWM